MYKKNYKKWLSRSELTEVLFLSLAITLAYSASTTISLEFISLPGKIASVWLPSGLTFALVALLKAKAFPGIVWGSMFGLASHVLEWQDTFGFWSIIFLNLICTLANCLQPWLATQLIEPYLSTKTLFASVQSSFRFIVASTVSPMLSATLGITVSCVVGTLPWLDYGVCWVSWWLASTLAHLIFTPPILLIQAYLTYESKIEQKQKIQEKIKTRGLDIILITAVIFAIAEIDFFYGYPIAYVLFAILIFSVFRLGGIFSSLLVATIALMAIVATAQGRGSFSYKSANESIILLQSFIGVLSITGLILLGILRERRAAQHDLEKTLENLELIVNRRTQKLRRAEAQLNGFFSSAPIGMGIFDRNLKSVRINEFLKTMIDQSWPNNQTQLDGLTIDELIDDSISRSPKDGMVTGEDSDPGQPNPKPLDLESYTSILSKDFFRQIFLTGQPVLNHEINLQTDRPDQNPKPQSTWLVSCFPIFDSGSDPSPLHVGLVLKDISDRKQLELHLKRQAQVDGLTQVFNRRYFDEALQVCWQQSQRSQQPISLILCDADYFKLYNDTYGHLLGDRCLMTIARILQETVRQPNHVVARYGGEEFVVLLPDLASDSALELAQEIGRGIQAANLRHEASLVSDRVTLSMGLATMIPKPDDRPEKLIDLADRSLYQAKKSGRNRVCIRVDRPTQA